MAKHVIGTTIGSYSFSPSTKQITFSGVSSLTGIQQILLITNVNNAHNKIIYQFNNQGLGGTFSGSVLTLDFDTNAAGMTGTDELHIVVDLPESAQPSFTHLVGFNNDRAMNASEDRRLLVQTFGATMMEEGFLGNSIDTTNRWNQTLVGAGSQFVTESTLNLTLGTGATDSVELEFNTANIIETVGGFAQFNIGYRFDTLTAGTRREFGYRDTGKDDGAFFRYDGTSLDFVTVKTGVESIQNLDAFIPNGNFNLYSISHLGSGKVGVFISGILVHDFAVGGTSLVGDKEKRPFIKNYNTSALGAAPTNTEIHWLNLIDLSGSKTGITARDDNNNVVNIAATPQGRLKVEIQPPAPPPATTEIREIQKGSVSGTVDHIIPITNGESITIQRLSGGAETSNSGSIIELFEDPNGDLSVLNPIEDIYVNGSSNSKPLNDSYDGDGTRRIILRRRQISGGTNDTTARVEGFETIT